MAAQHSIFISLFLVIFALLGAKCSVPVLMWGSNSLSSLPVPLAGHSISSISFQKNYLEKLTPCKNCDARNLVLFVQDKLSIEDFTHYGRVFEDTKDGGIFNNVKSFMGEHPSLSLSSVHLPADVATQLKKKFDDVQELREPKDVGILKPGKHSRLLVVHLPDTHGSGRIEEKLKKNDKQIGEVLKKYADAGVPYTAMYTARESSKTPTSEAVIAQGRHLLAAKEQNGTAVEVKDCMLAYYTKVSIVLSPIKGGKSVSQVLMGKPDSTKSTCDNSSSSMILTWDNSGENVTKVTIKMLFNWTRHDYWEVQEMLLTYTNVLNGSTTEKDVKMAGKSITAWKGYSYHCSNTGRIKMADTVNATTLAALIFEGFQVQPFAVNKMKFGYPNDCIGFFTIPIWSGIVTTFILIGILTFGLYMIMMINTVDRFDDPKGKTITVNVDDKS